MNLLLSMFLAVGLCTFCAHAKDMKHRGVKSKEQKQEQQVENLSRRSFYSVKRKREHFFGSAGCTEAEEKISSKCGKNKTDSKSSKSKSGLGLGSTLTVITPPQNSMVVANRLVDIEGKITPFVSGFVEAVGFGVVATILSSGYFAIRNVYLPEGETDILVSAIADDGTAIGEASLKFFYARPSEGSGLVTTEYGGVVEVIDQGSPLYGAKIEVPPGFAARDFQSNVIHDPDHVPLVPFRYIAVGPPVSFAPEMEVFYGFVSLTIPINPVLIPDSLDSTYAKVLRLGDDGWEELVNEATILTITDENRLSFNVDALDAMAFVPVVEIPRLPGQVLVETEPAAARLYIDGVASGTSPALLSTLQPGEHTARIYLPGYKELIFSFNTLSQGTSIKEVLEYSTELRLNVLLEGYLDGLVTTSSFVEIVAHVSSFEGDALDEGAAIISINGKESMQVVIGGQVRGYVTLNDGYNHVEVRVIDENGNTGVSHPAIIKREIASVPSRLRRHLRLGKSKSTRRDRELNLGLDEIKIVLSWDTASTDIDLHVFDPTGNHAFFNNKDGIPGASIDVDDRNGYGPEIFSYLSPVPGIYRVTVDAFNIHNIYTTAALEISVGGRVIFSGSYLFTESDFNDTNGDPDGASPHAFWNASTFEIGSLAITRVETQQESVSTQAAIFTTMQGENEIFITTSAPENVHDSDILYDIEEVVEGFVLVSPSTVGRRTSFVVRHAPLTSLTLPASHALEFRIKAYTLTNGERQESAPVVIRQDWRSQIRQEYLDKQEFDPNFVRQVPSRDLIISRSQFALQFQSPYFTFDELAQYSDYYSTAGLSVIQNSAAIANTLRTAWGYPLRCTSGWRNPRRNDGLSGSVPNSFHQVGDAVDLNPSWDSSKWPSNVPGCGEVTSFETAQAALFCLARQTFDQSMYFIDLHNNHLHVHQHTSEDADGDEKYGVEQSSETFFETGSLTILGEGISSYVYWPETPSSGVTLGIGYDIGSRSAADVRAQLMEAGMAEEQATLISGGAGLKGVEAKEWVQDNRAEVGLLDEVVVRRLFAAQLPEYTQQAKALATDTNDTLYGARSREVIANKPLYTYVMTEDQWNSLHPAMVELITDLKFHGGFYGYDRIARINELLIEHDGNHLEQFKQIATLFVASEVGLGGGYSYMDTYALAVGLTPGNTETFYGVAADALRGCTERRGRIRLSFIKSVISALERGEVEMKPPPEPSPGSNDCILENPHEAATCEPGSDGCYTPRASFVRNAIISCFPDSQLAPTTYKLHSGYGNSLDAWPKGGGYRIKADGDLKIEMDKLALWLMENHSDLKIYYIMFYNRIWNPSRDAFGIWWDCNTPLPGTNPPKYRCVCAREGTCGDVTQGHFDHLHLTVLF